MMNNVNKKIHFILSLLVLISVCFLKTNAPFFLEANTVDFSEHKEIKTLVLIIASDGNPAYLELQKVWKAYMNSDPAHFEVYFIRGNSSISLPIISGNDLIVKSEESYKPGILEKTVLSIEALLPRLDEFDFVIRTNLSSFYAFPKLLNFLKTLPRTHCCSGVVLRFRPEWGRGENYKKYISGAGIIMSSDVAKMIVEEKEEVLKESRELPDDEILGHFFESKNISFIPTSRKDFPDRVTWYYNKHTIDENDFHFRAKSNFFQRSAAENYYDELFINRQLLKKFYSISLENSFCKINQEDKDGLIQTKKILLGVVIKDNDKLMPAFLKSLECLNYDKKHIHLQISNCNQTLSVRRLLKNWIQKNHTYYAQVTYTDYTLFNTPSNDNKRFGEIKNIFLNQTRTQGCDYCFILESDTYLAPYTLAYLLNKNKPIISPLLRPLPYAAAHFRNFYVDATEEGYFKPHPNYFPITYNQKIGVFKVKCLKSAQLIQSDYLDQLTFDDGGNDWDFLSFCRSANLSSIDQYICNEIEFGYFLHHEQNLSKAEEKAFKIIDNDDQFDFYEYLFDPQN